MKDKFSGDLSATDDYYELLNIFSELLVISGVLSQVSADVIFRPPALVVLIYGVR